ncbi:MAG TPA: BrxA/BrxB family bacilliredoxin [Bacteroidota bacterium]|nr:BrxA/BrxB family bacilliredoxin [Bacteroidota bacterium]
MQYEPRAIQPFRDELTRIGFREMRSAEEVDRTIAKAKGTNLIVINSVCGCAAGKARPGIAMALKRSAARPDELTTVFAGGDIEATARVREHLGNIPPSSPSMALYKDGQLVHFIPRYQIENRDAFQIAEHLVGVFQEFCAEKAAAAGPSGS